jgi:hypothetical protein
MGRGRRYPAETHTVAVCASLRLRCAARSGVGVAELTPGLEGPSVQTTATSQFTMRASAPAPGPSITAAPEIAPTGHRLPRASRGGCSLNPNGDRSKGGAGRAAAHRSHGAPRVCSERVAAHQRARALACRDCLNGENVVNAVSFTTGRAREQTRGELAHSADRLVDAPRPARPRLCRHSQLVSPRTGCAAARLFAPRAAPQLSKAQAPHP